MTKNIAKFILCTLQTVCNTKMVHYKLHSTLKTGQWWKAKKHHLYIVESWPGRKPEQLTVSLAFKRFILNTNFSYCSPSHFKMSGRSTNQVCAANQITHFSRKKFVKQKSILWGLIAGPKRGRPTPGFSIFIRSSACSLARSSVSEIKFWSLHIH